MSPPAPDPNGPDERNTPSVDKTLRILEDPLRRDIIDCCASSTEQIFDVEELADTVAIARGDTDRDELLTAMHHHHLPLLAETGVIDFDPQGGQLRYRPDERVETWLRRIHDEGPE